jgi:glycosyltransferase involved in cell wall biosynthesis
LPEFIGAMFIGKIRYLVVEHSPVPWDGREILGKIVRRFLRLRACKFISVNPNLLVWPSATKPFAVIPNPIEVGSLIFNAKENRGNIQRLVYIGRLEPRFKRPQMFLNICEEIKLPGLVIGHGEDFSKLMEIARLRDLEIEFLGFQENPWNLLRVGDLLVVPSATEGDGLVVAEAILLGVPVIVSDILAFRNFKLNEICYSKSSQEFVGKIATNLDSIENFVPPPEIVKLLSSRRDLSGIIKSWEGLLLEDEI